MPTIGTPLTPHAKRVLLLGSGELGKEVAIELQRFGVEVIAVDRYADAPAMQVAHRCHVIDMLDGDAVRAVIALERPHLVVPEIEAIHTETLVALEREWNQAAIDGRPEARVIPTARAARLTMDREGIRRLAAEELGVPVSPYRFVDTLDDYRAAIDALGLPCVVKPVMSSSGHGQSIVRKASDIDAAWAYAQTGGRAGAGRVIVEGFVDFDYEITLLTVRNVNGTSFCEPIAMPAAPRSARRSATCSATATIARAGSRSPCPTTRWPRRRAFRAWYPMRSAAGACSAWSSSSRAMTCGFRKSRRGRTTPAW